MVPATPTEPLDLLRRIWCEVLDVADVAENCNFFDIGGNSLLALEVAARACKEGVPMPMSGVFRYPVLAELARSFGDPGRRAGGPGQLWIRSGKAGRQGSPRWPGRC